MFQRWENCTDRFVLILFVILQSFTLKRNTESDVSPQCRFDLELIGTFLAASPFVLKKICIDNIFAYRVQCSHNLRVRIQE